jgi:hypothetical protein
MHVRGDKCLQNFGRKPKGKRPFERPRRRWDDIRMVLRDIGWENVNWIYLTHCSVAGSYENDNEPSGSKKGVEFLEQLSYN